MRQIIIILLTLISVASSGQKITGVVLDLSTKKPLQGSQIFLVKHDYSIDSQDTTIYQMNDVLWLSGSYYKILQASFTDLNGKYSFNSIPTQKFSVIAKYLMPSINGLRGQRIAIDSNIDIASIKPYSNTIYLMVTCPYNKTKNQLYCPKCKRKDKAIPIVFGLVSYNAKGKIEGFPYKEFYNPGCEVDLYCNPTKHCKRCNKDF